MNGHRPVDFTRSKTGQRDARSTFWFAPARRIHERQVYPELGFCPGLRADEPAVRPDVPAVVGHTLLARSGDLRAG
jgi:hypothetical protein